MDPFRRYDKLKSVQREGGSVCASEEPGSRVRSKGLNLNNFLKENEGGPNRKTLGEEWLAGWMREALRDFEDVEVLRPRTIKGKRTHVIYGGLIVRGRRLRLEPLCVSEGGLESSARLVVMERGEGLGGRAEGLRLADSCCEGSHVITYKASCASGPISCVLDLRREVLAFAARGRFDTPEVQLALQEGEAGVAEVSFGVIFPEKDVMSTTFEKLAATSARDLPVLEVTGRTERNIMEQIAATGLGLDIAQEVMEDYGRRRGPASLKNLMRWHFIVREPSVEESAEAKHMKLEELDPYFPDNGEAGPYAKRALEAEVSKEGLRRFHEETGMYLVLTLMDDESASSFDMEGTWPATAECWDGPSWDETGIFGQERPRREDDGDVVYVLADIPNLFDAINFFGAGRGFADMIAEG